MAREDVPKSGISASISAFMGLYFTHFRAFWRSKLRIIPSYIFMNGSRRYSNHYGLEAQNYSRRIIFHDFLEFASRRGYSLYFHDFAMSEHLEYLMYELTTDLHFKKRRTP